MKEEAIRDRDRWEKMVSMTGGNIESIKENIENFSEISSFDEENKKPSVTKKNSSFSSKYDYKITNFGRNDDESVDSEEDLKFEKKENNFSSSFLKNDKKIEKNEEKIEKNEKKNHFQDLSSPSKEKTENTNISSSTNSSGTNRENTKENTNQVSTKNKDSSSSSSSSSKTYGSSYSSNYKDEYVKPISLKDEDVKSKKEEDDVKPVSSKFDNKKDDKKQDSLSDDDLLDDEDDEELQRQIEREIEEQLRKEEEEMDN